MEVTEADMGAAMADIVAAAAMEAVAMVAAVEATVAAITASDQLTRL